MRCLNAALSAALNALLNAALSAHMIAASVIDCGILSLFAVSFIAAYAH